MRVDSPAFLWWGSGVIVAIAQQKGGVAKSTTAISLAVEAHGRGLRTLLVDGDEQRSCLDWGEVAAQAGHSSPSVIGMAGSMHRPDQLPRLAADHDLVVVDLPPRNDRIARSALMIADVVLLPSGGTATDVWALRATLALVAEAREMRSELAAAIVLTRIQPNTVCGRAARGVLEASELPVLRTPLTLRVTYSEAIAAGQGPTTYDPTSDAADEVRRLLNEVLVLGGVPRVQAKTRRKPVQKPAHRAAAG